MGINLEGGGGEVSSSKSWRPVPSSWTVVDLDTAERLWLGVKPATGCAVSLVDSLTEHCRSYEATQRGNTRRAAGIAKLRQAVASIVAGALSAWARDSPRAVFQSRMEAAFSGELVGHAAFIAAEDALVSLGLLARRPGISYQRRDSLCSDHQRFATRLRPTNALLALAADHGLHPANVRQAFRTEYPSKAAVVRPTDLIQVRAALRGRGRSGRTQTLTGRLPDVELLAGFGPMRDEVAAANAEVAQHSFAGCRPPSWYRVFTGGPIFNGRWQAKGLSYQQARKADRADIRIDGAPVVELDLRASQLTILAALGGFALPDGDPYAVRDVPRNVIKKWVVVTLGNGCMPKKWSTRTLHELPEAAAWPVEIVQSAVLDRLPFLATPTSPAVIAAAGLEGLIRAGRSSKLLNLRIMAIEADAMTLAMRRLRAAGTIALPVHDSLIVPASAEAAARRAMRDACLETYGAIPEITGGLGLAA